MLEKNFCTIMTRSIKEAGGWAYKIPDVGMSLKPFDITGVYKGKALGLELKWIQKPQAFNLQRWETHQVENLLEVWKSGGWAALIIGVDWGRQDKRIYFWKNEELIGLKQRRDERRNILKKEFEALPYILMKNQKIDIDRLIL